MAYFSRIGRELTDFQFSVGLFLPVRGPETFCARFRGYYVWIGRIEMCQTRYLRDFFVL